MASKMVTTPDFWSANNRESSEPSCFGFRISERTAKPPAMVAVRAVGERSEWSGVKQRSVSQRVPGVFVFSLVFSVRVERRGRGEPWRTGDVNPVDRGSARADDLCAVRRARVRSEKGRVVVNRRLFSLLSRQRSRRTSTQKERESE